MNVDGKLLCDLIYDDAYYTEDNTCIIVKKDNQYGAYKVNGELLIECSNKGIEYYQNAKMFVTMNSKIDSKPNSIISITNGDRYDTRVALINLQGKTIYSSDSNNNTNISYVQELKDCLLVEEQILDDNDLSTWGEYWKKHHYIIKSDGTTINLTKKYGGNYSKVFNANEDIIVTTVYNCNKYFGEYRDTGDYELYENLDIIFHGYIDNIGNMLIDYTDKVKLDKEKSRIEASPMLREFHDSYARIEENNNAYFIDKKGNKISKSYKLDPLNISYEVYNNSEKIKGMFLYIKENKNFEKGIYDLDFNILYKFDKNLKYSCDKTLNYNSSEVVIIREKDSNLYGAFFTDTKKFTGFIYGNIEELCSNDESACKAIQCKLSDDKYDVYNFSGKLLFNKINNKVTMFSNGNLLLLEDATDMPQDAFITNTYFYKIVDMDGNVVFYNDDYRYICKADEGKFIKFLTKSKFDNDRNSCYGIMDSSGNVAISQEYHYGLGDSSLEYLEHNYFLCAKGKNSDINYYLVKANEGIALDLGKLHSAWGIRECGMWYCTSDNLNCAYAFWLNDTFDFNINNFFIYGENDKDTLAIGEELSVFVKEANVTPLQYNGKYSVNSSNTNAIEVRSQGTGLACAVLKGVGVGESTITFNFDDGKQISKEFKVELSNKNVLHYFPLAVSNNNMRQIFSDALECCYEINNSYSDGNDIVVSYFTGLKNGSKILAKDILSAYGIREPNKNEYVDEAVLKLMYEICKVDSSYADKIDGYSKKLSKDKDYYKGVNEGLKEYIQLGAELGSYDQDALLEGFSKIFDRYGKDVLEVSEKFVDMWDIVAVIIVTENIQIDMINHLLNMLEPKTELYMGLERLKIKLLTNFKDRALKEYIEGELVDNIAKSLIEKGVFAMTEFSPASEAIAKISINLLIDKYEEIFGGVMANDVCNAVYTTSFASEINLLLSKKLNKYQLGTVENNDTFEFLYNCYISSLCVALDSCSVICKTDYSFLKIEAEKYIKVIKNNCTYDEFMRVCKKEALNSIPMEIKLEPNEDGSLEVKGYYKKILKMKTIGNSNTNTKALNSEKGEVLYIPSEIEGKAISSIADNAFIDEPNIKGIIIAEGIKKIGKNAFKGCSNLEFVFLGNVSQIDKSAFENCKSLELVNLSADLQTIPYKGFANCTSMNTITIPKNVQKISDYAFNGNSLLRDAIIQGKNTMISEKAFETTGITDIYSHQNSVAEEFAITKGLNFHKTYYEEVRELSIHEMPLQIEFECGKGINTDGLKLKAILNDNREIIIDNGFVLDYIDEPGEQVVTIYYRNASTTYHIVLTEENKTETKIGDINADGVIDTADARMILQYCVGTMEFTDYQAKVADINKDGTIDTEDARKILLYCIGKAEI